MQGGIGAGNDSEYTDKEGHKLPDPGLDNFATQLLSFHRSAMFGFLFNQAQQAFRRSRQNLVVLPEDFRVRQWALADFQLLHRSADGMPRRFAIMSGRRTIHD